MKEKLKEIEKEALTNFIIRKAKNMISENYKIITTIVTDYQEIHIISEKFLDRVLYHYKIEQINTEVLFLELVYMKPEYCDVEADVEEFFIESAEYLEVKRKKREYVLSLVLDDDDEAK